MKPLDDEQLIAGLRALRPTPRPQFAAELDQRAAAGFPRRTRLPLPSLNRVRSVPGRHRAVLAGAAALAAVAIATIVALTSHSERSDNVLSLSNPSPPSARKQAPDVEYEAEAQAGPSASAAASEGSAQALNGGFQGNVRHRDVERSAEVVLGAEPEDVADDASRVFEAVHANNGIVMRSSTQQGAAGRAGARFALLIPSARLADALAAFSGIDEVLSRHEATADITAPTVGVASLLRDSRARIDSLLAELEGAESESAREAIEVELAGERRHASRLASQLDNLNRRANFSRVLLRIETGAPTETESGSGTWGLDDALRDAGHILSVAAAVTLIGLAILTPFALVALLAWFAHRTWVRRERRRALG